jgi:hypothetical protein
MRHPCKHTAFAAKLYKNKHKMNFVSRVIDFIAGQAGFTVARPVSESTSFRTDIREIFRNVFQLPTHY